jgi:hypothetical protein
MELPSKPAQAMSKTSERDNLLRAFLRASSEDKKYIATAGIAKVAIYGLATLMNSGRATDFVRRELKMFKDTVIIAPLDEPLTLTATRVTDIMSVGPFVAQVPDVLYPEHYNQHN